MAKPMVIMIPTPTTETIVSKVPGEAYFGVRDFVLEVVMLRKFSVIDNVVKTCASPAISNIKSKIL